MPNTFAGYKLIDPQSIKQNRKRFLRDHVPELDLANALYCPAGRRPARGWVLVRRGDLDQITNKYATFTLSIEDLETRTARAFRNLSIVQARCVSTGLVADKAAVYLVELTDWRGVLASKWFTRPTNSYYNVRSPAYPGDYYARSLNAGVPWTWATMVQDLWTQQTELGAWPGLPIAPTSTPENFSMPGVSSWGSMNGILEHLGLMVAADLTAAAPYTIVVKGAADLALTAAQVLYLDNLQDDAEWIDTGSGRVPGQVVVYFRTRYEVYGQEETVRRDALQWSMNAVYPVVVAAPAFFSGAQGSGHLWDDFTVRLDADGNALAADMATAAAAAAERAEQYYNEIYSGTAGYMHQTYAGCLPFATGAQVDGVVWRQDYRDGMRLGWMTDIYRGGLWPEVDDGIRIKSQLHSY